jgi:hypothetical protein
VPGGHLVSVWACSAHSQRRSKSHRQVAVCGLALLVPMKVVCVCVARGVLAQVLTHCRL